MTNNIAADVKAYILSSFLPDEDPRLLTPTTELIRSGILDSLATLSLVTFLEEKYGIELEAHDMEAHHLGTLTGIEQLVQRKLAAKR